LKTWTGCEVPVGVTDWRSPEQTFAAIAKNAHPSEGGMMSNNDPNKVWPTGLTLPEAEELHSYLIDGTRVFGVIAVIAHLLVAVSTPWLG
jgi:light-harvesting protein B-800-850 beta chain